MNLHDWVREATGSGWRLVASLAFVALIAVTVLAYALVAGSTFIAAAG